MRTELQTILDIAMQLRTLPGIALVLLATALSAQNSTGSLRGVVQDSRSARIAAAVVQLDLTDSSLSRVVQSDAQGEFRIESLSPGIWQVQVKAPGFAAASADVKIGVSSVRDITVTLQPESVRQSVSVSAQGSSISAQPIDLSSNVHQSVVTTDDL